MGWETRKRGGLYYYRSRWERGRVRKEYVGSGYVAQLAAQLDAIEREERETKARDEMAELDQLEALDTELAELSHNVTRTMRAELERAGYHRHHKGEWRKRSGSKKEA